MLTKIKIISWKLLQQISKSLDDRRSNQVFHRHNSRNPDLIPTHTTKHELRSLYSLARSLPVNSSVIEIGSYLGASTCYLAAGLVDSQSRLFCIDTWQNETMPDGIKDTFAVFQENTSAFKNIITPIRTRSDQLKPEDLPREISLTFIDGDHSYEAVKNDFELVSERTIDYGIVAFHDHRFFEGVRMVIGEALMQRCWVIIGTTHNLIWIRKEMRKPA